MSADLTNMLYEMRAPQSTAEKLRTIKECEEPEEFVRHIADLTQNYWMHEIYKPVRYSQSTGKPILAKWEASDRFDGYIYLHRGFNSDVQVSIKIREWLENIMEGNADVVDVDEDFWVIRPFEEGWNRTTVTAGVRITKANKRNR